MGRMARTEPQCLYKGALYRLPYAVTKEVRLHVVLLPVMEQAED